MAGLGAQELFIILLIVIVLFGASRLAGLGGALGSTIREFRSAVRDSSPDGETKAKGADATEKR